MSIPSEKGAIFEVLVKPNSKESNFLGEEKGKYLFSIKSPADKGKANSDLLKYIKKNFGVNCEIKSGKTSRKKLLEVL